MCVCVCYSNYARCLQPPLCVHTYVHICVRLVHIHTNIRMCMLFQLHSLCAALSTSANVSIFVCLCNVYTYIHVCVSIHSTTHVVRGPFYVCTCAYIFVCVYIHIFLNVRALSRLATSFSTLSICAHVCIYLHVYNTYTYIHTCVSVMGWLRLVGSLK